MLKQLFRCRYCGRFSLFRECPDCAVRRFVRSWFERGIMEQTGMYFVTDLDSRDLSKPLMAITVIWGKKQEDYLDYQELCTFANVDGYYEYLKANQ